MEWEAQRAAETEARRRAFRLQEDQERARWEAEDAASLAATLSARRAALEKEVGHRERFGAVLVLRALIRPSFLLCSYPPELHAVLFSAPSRRLCSSPPRAAGCSALSRKPKQRVHACVHGCVLLSCVWGTQRSEAEARMDAEFAERASVHAANRALFAQAQPQPHLLPAVAVDAVNGFHAADQDATLHAEAAKRSLADQEAAAQADIVALRARCCVFAAKCARPAMLPSDLACPLRRFL